MLVRFQKVKIVDVNQQLGEGSDHGGDGPNEKRRVENVKRGSRRGTTVFVILDLVQYALRNVLIAARPECLGRQSARVAQMQNIHGMKKRSQRLRQWKSEQVA